MVEKISRDISETLAGLANDDPDRPFLEKQDREFNDYLAGPLEGRGQGEELKS